MVFLSHRHLPFLFFSFLFVNNICKLIIEFEFKNVFKFNKIQDHNHSSVGQNKTCQAYGSKLKYVPYHYWSLFIALGGEHATSANLLKIIYSGQMISYVGYIHHSSHWDSDPRKWVLLSETFLSILFYCFLYFSQIIH